MRRVWFSMLLLVGCATTSATTAPTADAKSPTLTLKHLSDNSPWQLSQEHGHPVLLDVWATWCEPCRDSLPIYNQLAEQYGARGLKVFAINVDEDSSQIAAFMNEVKITVPVLLDPGALSAESALHVKLMPTAFLIDGNGVIRSVHEGFSDDAKAKYQTEIEALLAEAPAK